MGWSLVYSEDEFKTIEHSQFLPIHSSAGQSMPILDNQVPIPGQSVTSYVVNHRTSPLCWMVTTSLLGGQTSSPQVAIQFRSHPIHGQCMPILHQFQVNPVPVRCQWGANLRSIFHSNPIGQFVNCDQPEPILVNLCQSWPFQCQFQAIFGSHLSL